MSNKKGPKVKVDKDHFMRILRMKNCSIRKLGSEYEAIGRTERTIRRELNHGEMNPELLDSIAKYLNVDVDYLSQKPIMLFGPIKDEDDLELYYKKYANPERNPYQLTQFKKMNYNLFFESVLIYGGIDKKEFNKLQPSKRVRFREELTISILRLIAKYFDYDCIGQDTKMVLDYYESQIVDDKIDKTSYFAQLEGIGITEEDLICKDEGNLIDDYFSEKYEDMPELKLSN
ncbi:helix-turn-helix domain-containing protein [Faecalibaculum rodentium]|uniref:helix-turn-helix domain-containing protein n=1 Tax=Faecalibaculum rodentium TaxID=1702221 RepID=UPI00266EBFA8|nr:helix-turn-helix transcriptional regulator [Faecalibaculum rodentium]